jgi:hypothetical protein
LRKPYPSNGSQTWMVDFALNGRQGLHGTFFTATWAPGGSSPGGASIKAPGRTLPFPALSVGPVIRKMYQVEMSYELDTPILSYISC